MKQPSYALASFLEIQLQEAVLQADGSTLEALRAFYLTLENVWLDLSEDQKYDCVCSLFPQLLFPRTDFRAICGYFQAVALGIELTQCDEQADECTPTPVIAALNTRNQYYQRCLY